MRFYIATRRDASCTDCAGRTPRVDCRTVHGSNDQGDGGVSGAHGLTGRRSLRGDARGRVARRRALGDDRPPAARLRRAIPNRVHHLVQSRKDFGEPAIRRSREILLDDKPLFTTDTASPVITRGNPTSVSLLLRRVEAAQAATPAPAGDRPLQGTRWKATELAGKPTPSQNPAREAHLVFDAGGRVSGSDGCNRMTGSYELKGDVVTLGGWPGRKWRASAPRRSSVPSVRR